MSKENSQLEELKQELANFTRQKDNLFADYMRAEGIIAYLNAQLDRLDPEWRQKEQEKFAEARKKEAVSNPAPSVKEKKVYGNQT